MSRGALLLSTYKKLTSDGGPAPSYVEEVLEDNPMQFLALDDTSGTVAEDASPNNRDGTYQSFYTLGEPSLTPDVAGKSVKMTPGTLGLPPIRGSLATDTWPRLNGDFTIELRVQVLTDPTAGQFPGLLRRGGNVTGGYLMYYNASRQVNFRRDTLTYISHTVALPNAAANQAAYVALTYNKATTTLTLYIDGVNVASSSSVTWTDSVLDAELHYGRGDASNVGNHRMDVIAIHDHVLSGERMSARVGAAAIPPPGAIWTADASQATYLEWASESSGGSYNVLSSTSTLRRVEQQTTRVPPGKTRAYRIWMNSGDADGGGSSGQRSELGMGSPTKTFSVAPFNRLFHQGDDLWIAWWMYLGANYPLSLNNSWSDVTQLKQVNASNGSGWGTPVFSIECKNNQLKLFKSGTQGGENTGSYTHNFTMVKEQWVKLAIRVLFHTNPATGLINLYGDLADGAGYRQLVALQNRYTMKFDTDGVTPLASQARIGMYRGPRSDPTIATNACDIFFAGFNASSTKAGAEANAGF